MKKITVILLSVYLLAGCVAKPNKTTYFDNRYQYNNDISYANNVMHAAGIVTIKDAVSKKQSPITHKGGISAAGITLGTALEAFSDPASIGFEGAGLMNVAFWLSRPKAPESQNLIISWSDTSSRHSQIEDIHRQGTLSISLALKELTDRGFEPVANNGSQWKFSGVKIEDDTCGDGFYRLDIPECVIGFFSLKRNVNEDHAGRFNGLLITPAPSFVDHPENTVLLKNTMVDNMFTFNGKARFMDIDMLSIYKRVSEDLQGHVYIYLAPDKYTYVDKNAGLVKGRVPLVLHKGQVHLFIKYNGQTKSPNA